MIRHDETNHRYCVVHGHPQKKESVTDKPIGSIIKCYTYNPTNESSRQEALRKARALHYAITKSQERRSA